MSTLEKINVNCIAVCEVPIGVSENVIRSRVEKHCQYGQVLDTNKVASGRNLTKLVVLCSSIADVDHMCEEVKGEEIQLEDIHFIVKYRKAIACELPDRWESIEIPAPDDSQLQPSNSSTQGPQKANIGPKLPPRRTEQHKQTGGGQQQIPPNVWPPGPYGAMSGFYHNIPMYPQGDKDRNMKQEGIYRQMQMFANAHDHPSMQEHSPDVGLQQGLQQKFPFSPGCQETVPPSLHTFPSPETFKTDQHNVPGGQNIPFGHGIHMPAPMYIDPYTGQVLPFSVQGFPNMRYQQRSNKPPPTDNVEKFKGQTPTQPPADMPESDDGAISQGSAVTEEQKILEEMPRKVVVSKLPSTVDGIYLEMFFENVKKFGDCNTVEHVDVHEEDGTAIVQFVQPESVDLVLSKCPIVMMGQEVEVAVYKPKPQVSLCTIKVTGPCTIVCEEKLELLQMYFESKRHSGGGEIADSKYNSEMNMALITFARTEDAQSVIEKRNHMIRKEKLNVSLYSLTGQSQEAHTKEALEIKPVKERTIKVKGVNKSISRDALEFYFENAKRSGGGEIEEIRSDEGENVLFFTFKDKKDAMKVVERGFHKIDGKELNVSLYVPSTPPSVYENKILIKGINPNTTYDSLFNFIQAKTGYQPESMYYHAEQEDAVMIIFSENQDFQELEKIFRIAKLEGASLNVYQVPISSCIKVANLIPGITKDTVEFYFENTRKSGGGKVDKVVMNDDDTCLVYFADFRILDRVIGSKHVLSEQQLNVKRYQECLGRPEGEGSERNLNLPDPFKIKDICPQKKKFITTSRFCRDALKKEMQSCHARVVLPTDGEDITLKCALSKDVENCFILVKTWKINTEKCFDHFLNTLVVHQMTVLQDIWEKAVESLKSITMNCQEDVAVSLEKIESIVTVVGNKLSAENIAKSINQILQTLQEEAKIVKETVSLKSLETRMLLVSRYPNKIQEMFPELKLKIHLEKNEILFQGSRANVRDAKLKLYEIKSKYAQRSVENISTFAAGLFKVKQTKDYIVKRLKMQQLTGVWEIQGQSLVIISTSEQTIDQCASIICDSVMKQCVELTKTSSSVMNSEAWQNKVDEWHSLYSGKAHIAVDEFMTKVEIFSTEDIASELLESVKIFLGANKVLEETIPCSKHLHKLIDKHYKNEISQICKQLQSYHVSITSSEYNGCMICGTEGGIIKSKELLNKLFDKVKEKDRAASNPDLIHQMKMHSTKDDDLSSKERAVLHLISLKDESDKEQKCSSFSASKDKNNKIKVKASCKVNDNTHVYTAVGDLADMPVQVLVSTADEPLSLSQGLGKALISKGCLKADYIVHVIGPVWRGGENNEEDMLDEAVCNCMQQASEKGATSIAISAISCGAFGYPVTKGTKTIVKAMNNFIQQVQEWSISDIYLCDVKCNTVDSFTDALIAEYSNVQIKDEFEEEHNEVDTSNYSRQQMTEMGSDDMYDDEYFKTSVPISKDKVIIKGLNPSTTQDCLFNFIEAKTSFEPETMDCHADNDEVVMVTFTENPVIGRKHELRKQLLDVKRYQEWLGRPEGVVAENKLHVPDPVKMKDVNRQKLKFLKSSKSYHELFEKQMQSCFARIHWPTDGGDVILECTLTKDVRNCFKLVKTWKKTAEDRFDDFLKTIAAHQISVLQNIWDKVMKQLKLISITNHEAVAVFVDKSKGFVTIVGNKPDAECLAKNITDLLLKSQKLKWNDKKIKEIFNSLKPIETRMLFAHKFPNKMMEMFPELNVKINQTKNEILFEGSLASVRDAKLKMYEMKNEFAV